MGGKEEYPQDEVERDQPQPPRQPERDAGQHQASICVDAGYCHPIAYRNAKFIAGIGGVAPAIGKEFQPQLTIAQASRWHVEVVACAFLPQCDWLRREITDLDREERGCF